MTANATRSSSSASSSSQTLRDNTAAMCPTQLARILQERKVKKSTAASQARKTDVAGPSIWEYTRLERDLEDYKTKFFETRFKYNNLKEKDSERATRLKCCQEELRTVKEDNESAVNDLAALRAKNKTTQLQLDAFRGRKPALKRLSKPELLRLVSDARAVQEKAHEEIEDRTRCRVCLDVQAAVVFMPCKHRITCVVCSRKVLICPICKRRIEQKFTPFD